MPVDVQQLRTGADARQWEINGYCVADSAFTFVRFPTQLVTPLVIPVSQIPLRRDGTVDSERVEAMIQLHIDAMAAQDQDGIGDSSSLSSR